MQTLNLEFFPLQTKNQLFQQIQKPYQSVEKLKNRTSLQIPKILFENSKPTFESHFSERKQFDANSCHEWLVTGMCSYLINLPEISGRYNAFDIAYNFLERYSIIQNVISFSPRFSTEDQMTEIAYVDFLIHVLANDPERFLYFRQSPPEGI